MNDLIFHHIGIACEKIRDEVPYYKLLGYVEQGQKFEDPKQGICGLFMDHGGTLIELLEPLSKDSPIHSYLRRGIRMYHQGFLCEDVIDTSLTLVEKGAIIVSPPKPSIAFGNRQVSFLMLPNRMLIELIGH